MSQNLIIQVSEFENEFVYHIGVMSLEPCSKCGKQDFKHLYSLRKVNKWELQSYDGEYPDDTTYLIIYLDGNDTATLDPVKGSLADILELLTLNINAYVPATK